MNTVVLALYGTLLAGTAAAAVPGTVPVSSDSVAVRADTTAAADSADTVRTPAARKAALDDSVRYSADTIRFFINEKKIRLTGRAVVKYQGITLNAHTVTLFSDTRNLEAGGRFAVADGDTVWSGTPVLTDREGSIEGFRMVYNLETRRGRIIRGSTSFEQGHYQGSTVALVGNKELNTADGDYTTCDHTDDPHYTFHSRRMKLYINDKAILKPVTLSFRDVPVVALPFYILPLKPGRHSGLLMPRYGEDNLYGKYLKNIGYYYAPSPYWDAKLAVGFYSSARNQVEGAFRYKRRYVLEGSIKSSYLYDAGSAGATSRWDLKFNHSHELAPGWSMRAYGTFVSDRDYFNDYRETVEERSERDLRSGAYITRRGERTTTTANVQHNKKFLSDRTTTDITLPSVTFSAGGQVFPGGSGSTVRQSWYRKLRYSYSNGFTQTLARETDTTDADTAGYHTARTWRQNTGLSYSGAVLPWLNVTPGLTYSESYNYADAAPASQQGTYALKTGLNTTLYGMFPVGLLGLEVLRHTLDPSVNLSYSRTVRTAERAYRPFAAEAYDDPVRSLGVGLNNLFQAKVTRDSTTRKLTLLTGPNISTSYNFDSERWNDLSTSMTMAAGNLLRVNMRFVHSMYAENSDRLLAADGGAPLRELSRTVTVSTSGGTNGTFPYWEDVPRYGITPSAGIPLSTVTRPWSLSAGYTTVTSRTRTYSSETRNLTGRASLNLTRNLKAAYSATYNMKDYEFISQKIELYRDLHCWEATLNWTPTGYRKGFYFRVNIRDIPDVKVEQSIKYD